MADSTGTGDSDTLGKMLRLLESMDARMERRETRAAEKDAAKASAQHDESASKTDEATTPVVDGNERVVGMLSKILGALKDRTEDRQRASSLRECGIGLNICLGQDDTASAAAAEPAVEPVGDTPEQSDARGGPTVVGLLSQIVGVLKDAGFIHSEKEKDGERTSPFTRKRFGLNFQQAQRGNGMCISYPSSEYF